jgi:hypothetical protein
MFELTIHTYGSKPIKVQCVNLKEAADKWNEFRDKHNFGASMMQKGCGDVRVNGKLCNRISYNGRVWTVGRNPVEVPSGR